MNILPLIARTTFGLMAGGFALAPYTNAQDTPALMQETKMLRSSDHGEMMRAVTAACLLTPKDRKAVMARLEQAGWNVAGQDDWIEADHNNVWITLLGSNDDFSCDVSGNIPQSEALAITKDLLVTVNWPNWTVTPEGSECYKLAHPQGLGIYISSGGNDTVCTLSPDSTISVSLQGGL